MRQERSASRSLACPGSLRSRQGHFARSDATQRWCGLFTPTEPEADGLIRYEAAGLVDGSGRYQLGLNGDRSGAPTGDYKVTIQPREYQELPQSNVKRIPPRYRDQAKTPLKVTVKEGENAFNFDLN
jgi:hypothetical protein